MPSPSVIVRARNEARHLPYLLEQIRRQNFPGGAEIVVVDSGSTDGTVEIARRGADVLVQIDPEEFTFGRSLNRGCEAASGDIFVIVSAHTYPASNNWLSNMVGPFDDPSVAMVYGRQLPHPHTTRLGEARDFAVMYETHSKVLIDEPFGNNANSAVRAEVWRNHRFDEALTGLEDIEWARHVQRLGYSIFYAATAGIVHIHEESPRQVYRRLFREGAAHAELFPTGRETGANAVLRAAADVARDLHYGRASGATTREILEAPVFRVAAAAGFHRGSVERQRRRAELARRVASNSRAADRAVVVSGEGQHALVEREAERPAHGEVLIRVAYVGVCATDVEIADGRQPYYTRGVASFPIVPGHEYSGVVTDVGSPELQGLVGRRVVAECVIGCGRCAACRSGNTALCPDRVETGVLKKDGSYATHVTVPARVVHAIPDGLPLLSATLTEPFAVVLKALRKAGQVHGRRAAVVGAGPIGHIASQALRAFGAEVLVIDRDERRLDPMTGMAFSTSTELSSAQLAGMSLVLEATGAAGILGQLADVAEPGAQIVLLGVPAEDGEQLSAATLVAREQEIVGSLASDPVDWPNAIGLLNSGRAELGWLLDNVRRLEDYADSWENLRERAVLKTILSVEPDLAAE